ncbi:uncharacterized protein FYW47_010602 [Aplochiton taeniatus]
MARGESPGIWQLLLTISLFVVPLHAHGRHSSATAHRRQHHHSNHSGHAVEKSGLPGKTVLSDDSAERDHLIGLGAGLPVRASGRHQHHKHAHLDFSEEEPVVEELTAGGAGADQPANPFEGLAAVEFHSPAPNTAPSDLSRDWPRALQPLQQKAAAPTPWTLSDFYDYLAPDDDLSAVDTTPEPEPSPSLPADMEDENPLLAGSSAAPTSPTPKGESGTSLPAPPAQTAQTARPARPAQPAQPARPAVDSARGQGSGLGGQLGPDGCRLGYVRSGTGVCVSQCDAVPRFCYNGGVCTVVEGMGAFCRCNVQDYIWNKGSRCDWMITEFQVLCVLVGVGSLVLLLLFMIIVFFAKRLHRLKTENNRLRKRSKHRPQSEQQTDGFSVSTVTDGSHPNVRKLCDTPPPPPQAHAHNLAYYDNIICQDDPQKTEDAVKSPPKEEECLNIRNSHSPKQENNRPGPGPGDHERPPNNTEDVAEVNSLQNNLV